MGGNSVTKAGNPVTLGIQKALLLYINKVKLEKSQKTTFLHEFFFAN